MERSLRLQRIVDKMINEGISSKELTETTWCGIPYSELYERWHTYIIAERERRGIKLKCKIWNQLK
ncbi:MAG: hypothetical protein WC979_03070 [Candidatus Pacearchaeota archaeon]|jgi:hypothetical protein|nr:hypothetical protein [Clostridia bacterium]